MTALAIIEAAELYRLLLLVRRTTTTTAAMLKHSHLCKKELRFFREGELNFEFDPAREKELFEKQVWRGS